ncbi:MAG: Glu-tRNA(Gln) amidotransferase subunit GatE [Candidatus Aenigmarchaeota archaeon]|nr:Glu-tRNA(Gln) amidotransferase subunit GatE [Candidatus Aenigmarchaeota archaeon]
MPVKIGLEIHQQLDTAHKLFCACPILKEESFPLSAKRRMRAVAGEMGNVDPAAFYEAAKGREFTYRFNPRTSCLVELDESPPNVINEEALRITLQACKLLHAEPVDEVHVMRKTVADGSAVSGFQRTALVALGGSIKLKSKMLRIQTVCLEEDSAPSSGVNEYRLDRLGVPLIEIATEPDIASPGEAREAAEAIGTLLRSLRVRRGIGSIRQDINVSVPGGTRVEIKGFQELERIPDAVSNEIARQESLLGIKEKLAARKASAGGTKDVTSTFAASESEFIRNALNEGGKVIAGILRGFASLLREQCGDRTFGKELSGYAAAYGYGIMHSDEDVAKYGLTREFSKLKEIMGASQNDLIFIVAGRAPEKAAHAVLERASLALQGVPKETRVADGVGSRYTRPLPGSERMYPETDVPFTSLGGMKVDVPQTIEERERDLKKVLPPDVAAQLARSGSYHDYENALKKHKIEPMLVATTLLSTMKELKRKGLGVERITEDELDKLFALVESGKIPKSSVTKALEAAALGATVEEAAKALAPLNAKELAQIIEETVKANPGREESALMGMVMSRVRGRAEGNEVAKLLKDAMKRK